MGFESSAGLVSTNRTPWMHRQIQPSTRLSASCSAKFKVLSTTVTGNSAFADHCFKCGLPKRTPTHAHVGPTPSM